MSAGASFAAALVACLACGLLGLTLLGAALCAARRTRRAHAGRRVGPYELGAVIGEGGMGVVYRARHVALGRTIALKLARGEADATARRRLVREAQITSELAHPNIVALLDHGESEGTAYCALEYVDGLTLRQLVAEEGALTPARALHLLRQLAASLARVHRAGFVHRDVKPSNVMVCHRDGHADWIKVLDFGLARRVDVARGERTSLVAGTPAFMAPEAASDLEPLGPAQDVYALGALGWFLLTGSVLFGDHDAGSIARAHRDEPPLPPSLRVGRDVPRELEDVLLCCLAKRPERRYPDACAVLSALDACRVDGWSERDATAWWLDRAAGGEPTPARRQPASPLLTTASDSDDETASFHLVRLRAVSVDL